MQYTESETSIGHCLVGIICLAVGIALLPSHWPSGALLLAVAIALLV
ncbi:hypothetical protein [Motilimonas eburnea]|nr:hypothetical protein [Motilimonas eburnea]MCE2571855.1 hypothetical protein [Motilimonas eburnea]